jgi:DNA-binding CsgD family transcriptional regulator
MARGGFAHAFVHRQDLSGLGLKDLLPLRTPKGTGPLRAAEFGIASSAIAAVFADADSAARELRRLPSVKPDQALTDPDLLVTSDLMELVLGQKAFDADGVDAPAHRLLGRSGDVSVPARPGLRTAVLLAQASAHLWHGRHEDVTVLLEEALTEAQRDGMPGLELDLFAALLASHAAVAAQWPVPAPRTTPETATELGPAASRRLPEPLTQRELTILRFLGTSMSPTEIADELRLSVNTVKTHLAHIYRKLAVSRRREAVQRARELELI